jgi:hypothetical protein
MFLVQNNWDFGFNRLRFVSTLKALSGNPNLKRTKPTPLDMLLVIEVTFMMYQVRGI